MATAIADKLVFTMAANSFQGAFAGTHGVTSAPAVTDARAEPTSCLSRLLFGTGSLNHHVAAAVSVICSTQYELPTLFEAIANDRPAELWGRERHVVAWQEGDSLAAAGEVNKVTYKTPYYILASAQDYHAGEAGHGEHIWQATLAADAAVFVTHPALTNLKDEYRNNFWRGNRVLPRVAQWKDLLVAIHRLPAGDWLGYTHAHFPLAAFDEHVICKNWAFARKGDAYLALYAAQGLQLQSTGPAANRELRSEGRENTWLCQMGCSAQDGRFAAFQKKVLDLPLFCNGDNEVALTSLRGDAIRFGWSGPLLVNGETQLLSGYKHYDNPYCTTDLGADTMEITYGDWLLRLNLDTADS